MIPASFSLKWTAPCLLAVLSFFSSTQLLAQSAGKNSPLASLGSAQHQLYVRAQAQRKGFTDAEGHFLLAPVYEDAHEFVEELAAVQVNGLWGFIDKEGKWKISPRFQEAGDFTAGIAPIRLGDFWGYVTRKGKIMPGHYTRTLQS